MYKTERIRHVTFLPVTHILKNVYRSVYHSKNTLKCDIILMHYINDIFDVFGYTFLFPRYKIPMSITY